MKKMITYIGTVMLLVLVMTGCCLSHDWQAATCDAPKTCAKCGETEGEKLEHTWVEATCDAPKTCSVCGATEGEKLEHVWSEPTCAHSQSCEVCGVHGKGALPHTSGEWEVIEEPTSEAAGTMELKCAKCGKVMQTKQYRAAPEKITVLEKDGFVLTEEEYYLHLLSYLPMEYTIKDGVLNDDDKYDKIHVTWGEGEQGYEDNVIFSASSSFTLEEFLEEFVMSIAPEAAEKYMDDIMKMWIAARHLGTGEFLPIPLSDTVVLVVYRGHSGFQAMFCTSRFVRGY